MGALFRCGPSNDGEVPLEAIEKQEIGGGLGEIFERADEIQVQPWLADQLGDERFFVSLMRGVGAEGAGVNHIQADAHGGLSLCGGVVGSRVSGLAGPRLGRAVYEAFVAIVEERPELPKVACGLFPGRWEFLEELGLALWVRFEKEMEQVLGRRPVGSRRQQVFEPADRLMGRDEKVPFDFSLEPS